LATKRPCAPAVGARAADIRNRRPAITEPEHQRDQRGVGFTETDELLAEGAIAPEEIDAAWRYLRLHQTAIKRPEERRQHSRGNRIRTRFAHSDHDIDVALCEHFEEARDDLGRFLQV